MDDRIEPTTKASASTDGDIEQLRQDLDALRAELRTEVRTHSLVVEEADGRERVVIAAGDDHGEVRVMGRGPHGETATIALHAGDPFDGEGIGAGLWLLQGGNVVAVLHTLEAHQPELWMDDGRLWMKDDLGS